MSHLGPIEHLIAKWRGRQGFRAAKQKGLPKPFGRRVQPMPLCAFL
jgi:hypothetical protein